MGLALAPLAAHSWPSSHPSCSPFVGLVVAVLPICGSCRGLSPLLPIRLRGSCRPIVGLAVAPHPSWPFAFVGLALATRPSCRPFVRLLPPHCGSVAPLRILSGHLALLWVSPFMGLAVAPLATTSWVLSPLRGSCRRPSCPFVGNAAPSWVLSPLR